MVRGFRLTSAPERLNVSFEGVTHRGMGWDLLSWMRLYGHTEALPRFPIVQQAVLLYLSHFPPLCSIPHNLAGHQDTENTCFDVRIFCRFGPAYLGESRDE